MRILFFFMDTTTTGIYTLSLYDALPIFGEGALGELVAAVRRLAAIARYRFEKVALAVAPERFGVTLVEDRKSTRLNSSHSQISYAVFCLKKKKRPPVRPLARIS